MTTSLSEQDLRQLDSLGITQAEVLRQIAQFENPPACRRLERPCTLNDGIRVLTDEQVASYAKAFDHEARQRHVLKFVPASGAASRMFKAVLGFRHQLATAADATPDAAVAAFFANLERFAFYADLQAKIAGPPSQGAQLDALLCPSGLYYPSLPKGLLEFHRYGTSARTPFEEHLVEAAAYTRDQHDVCRLHFTVSPQHLTRFEALLARVRPQLESSLHVSFQVGFSEQFQRTDTVAVDLDNRPLRDAKGRMIFRPGGHGALIENLNTLDADIVFIKNIDNVVPDHLKEPTLTWKRVLGAILVELQARSFEHLRQLVPSDCPPAAIDEALQFATRELCVVLPPALEPTDRDPVRAYLIDKLDRPLRVCGMVRNEGEPGGGPFWVRAGDGGLSLQIVESAEVDTTVPEQQQRLAAATHFNPVDLVCGLKNWRGERFDLHAYVDRDAVFITEKSIDGHAVKAIEHPGLWNGAMAFWNTVFVEVPSTTFNPVKTINDLLRPAHQPPN